VNQNPRHADFVLGNCPECQKVIRIPVTAVTSQSNSQVKCPICEASFEIADVLEETIPAVEVIDEAASAPAAATSSTSPDQRPERINAIDTPDLFHVSKEGYQPTTEKKNGRFVVPELLSKGNKSQKKRKRSRSRRKRENDPKLAESLAKLKENTSKTSLEESAVGEDSSNGVVEQPSERSRKSSRHSGEDSHGRSSSRGERGSSSRSGERGSSSRSSERGSSSRGERSSSKRGERGSSQREATIGNRLRSIRNRLKGSRNFGTGKVGSKVELIMIGIGLLLAIPLLHVLLWWTISVDPLGLSKPTSRIMPFLVPSSMRAPVETETVEPRSRAQETIIERRTPDTITRGEDGQLPKPKLDPSSIHSGDF